MSETQLAAPPTNATKVRGKPFQKGHAGGPGRKPGEALGITRTLREAVEVAARDCHPQGLAGWLVDRAQGGVQDRQIFANMVGKVIPIQVNQAVSGGVSISLNWLGSRNIGTITAQPKVIDSQTIDLIEDSAERRWIGDASSGDAAAQGLGATQQGAGYLGSQEPAMAQPAASESPLRASDERPPPPHRPDQGGPG